MRDFEENEDIGKNFGGCEGPNAPITKDPTFWSHLAKTYREKVEVNDEEDNASSSRIFCDAQNCDKIFEDIVDYEDHYEQRHKNQCSICEKSFPNAHGLEIHFDENHSIMFRMNLEKKTGFPRFRCLSDQCERRFLTFTERNEHSLAEHGMETGESMDKRRKMRRRVEHEAMRRDIEVLSLNPRKGHPSKLDFHFTDE